MGTSQTTDGGNIRRRRLGLGWALLIGLFLGATGCSDETTGSDGPEPDAGLVLPDAAVDAERAPADEGPADQTAQDAAPPDADVTRCEPGTADCFDARTVRYCGPDGTWQPFLSCPDGAACVEGDAGDRCVGACAVGTFVCEGRWLLVCDDKGEGYDIAELCPGNCVDGACVDTCRPGTTQPCAVPEAQGACAVGESACNADGAWGDCRPTAVPTPETCDGLDQDCDGQVDEALVEPCEGNTVGACDPGTRRCDAGAWTECEGLVAPAEEACDGQDNDCDGQADEAFDLQTDVEHCGACGTACPDNPGNFRLCEAGACVPDLCRPDWTDCDGDGVCERMGDDCGDACDGQDNDGDGQIDEDFVAVDCGVGACAATSRCEGGAPVACQPGMPAPDDNCDGVDDNCDGVPDDGYRPQACGVGACREAATLSMCLDGQEAACVPGQPAAADATCDGVDDDCDGTADEDYQPEPCGVGACASASSCVAGVEDCVPRSPVAEVCNTLDDDCDGAVDEGFDLQVDPAHCGACGRECAIQGTTDAVRNPCEAGRCVPDCIPGRFNLSGDPSDGCPCRQDPERTVVLDSGEFLPSVPGDQVVYAGDGSAGLWLGQTGSNEDGWSLWVQEYGLDGRMSGWPRRLDEGGTSYDLTAVLFVPALGWIVPSQGGAAVTIDRDLQVGDIQYLGEPPLTWSPRHRMPLGLNGTSVLRDPALNRVVLDARRMGAEDGTPIVRYPGSCSRAGPQCFLPVSCGGRLALFRYEPGVENSGTDVLELGAGLGFQGFLPIGAAGFRVLVGRRRADQTLVLQRVDPNGLFVGAPVEIPQAVPGGLTSDGDGGIVLTIQLDEGGFRATWLGEDLRLSDRAVTLPFPPLGWASPTVAYDRAGQLFDISIPALLAAGRSAAMSMQARLLTAPREGCLHWVSRPGNRLGGDLWTLDADGHPTQPMGSGDGPAVWVPGLGEHGAIARVALDRQAVEVHMLDAICGLGAPIRVELFCGPAAPLPCTTADFHFDAVALAPQELLICGVAPGQGAGCQRVDFEAAEASALYLDVAASESEHGPVHLTGRPGASWALHSARSGELPAIMQRIVRMEPGEPTLELDPAPPLADVSRRAYRFTAATHPGHGTSLLGWSHWGDAGIRAAFMPLGPQNEAMLREPLEIAPVAENGDIRELQLHPLSSGFVAAWILDVPRPGESRLQYQTFDLNGTPVGAVTQLAVARPTSDSQVHFDGNADDLTLSWTEESPDGPGQRYRIAFVRSGHLCAQ